MDLKSVMRYSYLLGCVAGVIAILYRVVLLAGVKPVGFAPRTILEFSGFLFVVCIATGVYAHLGQHLPEHEKEKSQSAGV